MCSPSGPARPDRVLAVFGVGLVDPTEAHVRADDLCVLRGEGVFETVLVAAGRPVLLAEHLTRFTVSAKRVGVALPAPDCWRELVELALSGWNAPDGVLRLLCTKGPEADGEPVAFALLSPLPVDTLRQRSDGVDVVTLTLGVAAAARAAAPWLLGGVKATSYAVNMAALRAAAAHGAEDVVFVSSDGDVLEGPTSTAAWVREGRLVTPPPDVGILPGTTVAAVLALCEEVGLHPEIRRTTVEELRAAEELLLLSSVRTVVGVRTLDGTPLPGGPAGKLLRSAFERRYGGPAAS